MNPQPHIRNSPRTVQTILADKAGARLHSDVHTGGGIDDTAAPPLR